MKKYIVSLLISVSFTIILILFFDSIFHINNRYTTATIAGLSGVIAVIYLNKKR